MPGFRIAGIPVWLEPRFAPLLPQSKPHAEPLDRENCRVITMTDDSFESAHALYPGVEDDLLEYMLTGGAFYKILIQYQGMMLHASAVEWNEKAYLFSAPSGTGKSTHTSLWLKEFPGSAILNDDKPALRLEEGAVFVYGTPWSGKTDLNLNHRVPLGGICFLERGKENHIRRLSTGEAVALMLDQTVRPSGREPMTELLNVLDGILRFIPVYVMQCNMEPEAAHVSHRAMTKGECI